MPGRSRCADARPRTWSVAWSRPMAGRWSRSVRSPDRTHEGCATGRMTSATTGRMTSATPGRMTAAPPVALYVHIPFCVSVCPYCDFVVYPGADARGPRNRVAAFVAAVLEEMRLRADALDERWGRIGMGRQ